MTTSAASPSVGTGGGLSELVGHSVEVISMEGHDRYTDNGTLESFQYPWLSVRKKGGELLCFSVYNIRIVKLAGK